MEEVLQRASATIKQDKIWKIPMADVFQGDMLDFHDELSKIEIGQSITIDTRIHSEIIVRIMLKVYSPFRSKLVKDLLTGFAHKNIKRKQIGKVTFYKFVTMTGFIFSR